jgi:hypothetical protein
LITSEKHRRTGIFAKGFPGALAKSLLVTGCKEKQCSTTPREAYRTCPAQQTMDIGTEFRQTITVNEKHFLTLKHLMISP